MGVPFQKQIALPAPMRGRLRHRGSAISGVIRA
jgi:hypothetical protein